MSFTSLGESRRDHGRGEHVCPLILPLRLKDWMMVQSIHKRVYEHEQI